MPTDAEIDAATLAYVAARWTKADEWRRDHPQAWIETRERIAKALEAAAAVRAAH